jgi:hypothetical protein
VVRCDEDVLGLEVAVDDAGVVHGREPFADLPRDVATQLLGDALQFAQQLAERLPLDVLHHQEARRRTAGELLVAVQRAHDVVARMNRLKNPGVSSRCGCTTFSATTPSGPVAA